MSNRMIRGRADAAMDIVVYVIMILMSIIFLYPVTTIAKPMTDWNSPTAVE